MFTAFVKPTCIDRGLISAYLWNIKYTRRRTYYTIQAYKKLSKYKFFFKFSFVEFVFRYRFYYGQTRNT